jgi:hypothetical protein
MKPQRGLQASQVRIGHCSVSGSAELSAPLSASHLGRHFGTDVFGYPELAFSRLPFAGSRFNRFASNHESCDGDRYWKGDNAS